MSRHAKQIATGNAAAQHLSAGLLALCFPMARIQAILEDCGKLSGRERSLPAPVMVFFVIALSLFPDVSYQSVLRWLLNGLQWLGNLDLSVSVKSSLAEARQRLGAEPLRRLHEQCAMPLADGKLRGSYWKGLHLVALDGSTLALQDTAANAGHYGRPSNQHGGAAWPLARFVALVEVGTHLVFKAALGSYHDSEITLAWRAIGGLRSGMLCLADRLFPGFELWKAASAQGCALLWRAKAGLNLEHVKTLRDGSWLARWHPDKHNSRSKQEAPHLVRVVEYRLRGRGQRRGGGEVLRLITTLLDPASASAKELAALYPQRWEIELSIKESKAILRKGSITLRSKLPEMVEQEFWGMLLAHYAVRRMMALAALEKDLDPDQLAYQESVEIIKAKLAGPPLPFSPSREEAGLEADA